jgi:hypothetical protein
MTTYTWKQLVKGAFTDPSNWFGGVVPGSGDDIVVYTGVEIDNFSNTTATVHLIQVNSGLPGPAVLNGNFTLTYGVSGQSDLLKFIGELTIDGATIQRLGFDNGPILPLPGNPIPSTFAPVSLLVNIKNNANVTLGDVDFIGAGNNTVSGIDQSGGTLTINDFIGIGGSSSESVFDQSIHAFRTVPVVSPGGTAEFKVVGGTATDAGSATVEDNGLLEVDGGKFTAASLTVYNSGAFKVQGGSAEVDGQVLIGPASGDFLTSSMPTVTIDGTGSAFSILGANGNLSVNGQFSVVNGASTHVDGNVSVYSSDFNSIADIGVGAQGNTGTSLSIGGDLSLGGGGGLGAILVGQAGYVSIGGTLTMHSDFNGSQSSQGGIGVSGGGALEIGGFGNAAGNTILIDPGGELAGTGSVFASNIINQGGVAALNGLLVLRGNVSGNGGEFISANSTLEINGSYDTAGTVIFAGTNAKLVLDSPSQFNGQIAGLAPGDTIELKGITVVGQEIGYDSNGNQILDIGGTDSNGNAVHLDYKISGSDNLNLDHFTVSNTGGNAVLSLTQLGTITTYWLDSGGAAFAKEVWGNTNGGANTDNVNVYLQNGTYVAGVGEPAENSILFVSLNLSNYQLTKVDLSGILGLSKTIDFGQTNVSSIDTNTLQNIQNPAFHNPIHPQNLWLALQYYFDTYNGNISDAPGNAYLVNILNGVLKEISTTATAKNSSTQELQSANASGALAQAGGSVVVDIINNTATGDISYYHTSYPDGSVINYYFNPAHTQSGISYNANWTSEATDANGNVTTKTYNTQQDVLAAIQAIANSADSVGSATQPLAALSNSGQLSVNPTPEILSPNNTYTISAGGDNLELTDKLVPAGGGKYTTTSGAGLADKTFGVIACGAGNLIGQDGAGVVACGAGNLIGQDGAGVVAAGAGNLIGQDGAGVVACGAGNIAGTSGRGTNGTYLANALVFADTNHDGVLDNGEAWTFTDASGNFTLDGGSGPLVMTGGVDTGTGVPFTFTLTAPLGSTDISPLTTLAAGLTQQTGNIDGSIAKVQTALGINSGINITTMDPIAGTKNGDATSATVYIDMSKVMDTVEFMTAALVGNGANVSTVSKDVFAAMTNLISQNSSLNLSNTATVKSLFNAVAGMLGIDGSAIVDSVAAKITASNQQLDNFLATDGSGSKLITDIVSVESSAQAGDGPSILSIAGITDTGAHSVNAGHLVTVTMNLSEAVTVTGTPTLQLNDNEVAAYTFGSGSKTLSFSYVAQTGDNVADLHVTGLNLPTGASILDGNGYSLAGSVTSDLGIQVDTVTVPLTSVQQQILGLYGVLYTRAADAGGLSYWTGVVGQQPDGAGVTVANGASTAITINDATVLGQLFVSTESSYFNQVYGAMSDSTFITTLYGTIGGNTIGIAPGITYWSGVLQALETAGQSQQAARAGIVGEIVQAMIDYNINIRPAGYTDAEWLAAQQRQETTDNKVAVSLAYSNASQQPGGNILDAVTVTDAAFLAATRVIEGVTYNGTTADAAISNILHAVALQDLTQIQPIGVVSGGLMG